MHVHFFFLNSNPVICKCTCTLKCIIVHGCSGAVAHTLLRVLTRHDAIRFQWFQ